MDVTITIPAGDEDAVRAEFRRRLGSTFPRVNNPVPTGERDADDNPIMRDVFTDDPAALEVYKPTWPQKP